MLLRFGKNTVNATPAASDLWATDFKAQILAAYDEHHMFARFVNKQTIEKGTSAVFPATWKIGAEVHAVGSDLLGMDTDLRSYTIYLDERPIVSHFETDDIDLRVAHFDIVSEVSKQMGVALGKRDDLNCAALLLKAARTTQGNATSFPGGGIDGNGGKITDANFALPGATTATATGAAAVLTAIDKAVIYWNLNDVPANDRYCIVGPALFQQIRKLGTLVTGASAGPLPVFGHRDIDPKNPGMSAAMNYEAMLVYNGVSIGWSNNIPQGDHSSDWQSNYAADYSTTAGVIFQKDAVGKVELIGVTMENFRDVRKQSELHLAKMLVGGGTLRPICAIELATA